MVGVRCCFAGFLEHAYNLKQQTLLETRVLLLDLLSKPLHGELQCARYESCLRHCESSRRFRAAPVWFPFFKQTTIRDQREAP